MKAVSPYRKAEFERTRENFSTVASKQNVTRTFSPNPILGSGYYDKPKGVRRFQKRPGEADNKDMTPRKRQANR